MNSNHGFTDIAGRIIDNTHENEYHDKDFYIDFFSAERVKGNRVKFPGDPVTVNSDSDADAIAVWGNRQDNYQTAGREKARRRRSCEPGNLLKKSDKASDESSYPNILNRPSPGWFIGFYAGFAG